MSLSPSQQVLSRYTLLAELPAPGDLWRWSARDEATGETVEVVAPRLVAALRPGAVERFAAARRGRSAHPALRDELGHGLHGKLPVAARAPSAGCWPDHPGPWLDPSQAREAAAWLGPAVAAAAPALGEGLRAEDLVVEADGRVSLAPAGLVYGDSLAALPRHRAPETPPGAEAGAAGALYGLGVLLFRATTGAWPVTAPSPSRFVSRQASPSRARDLRPDLPEDVAALLDGLVSPDPSRRLTALHSLPAPTPFALPALAPATPAARPVPAAPLRASAPPAARRDVALARWQVVVAPGALNAGALRRAAAIGGVPAGELRQAAAAGELIPLASAEHEAEARARLAELRAAGLPGKVVGSASAGGIAGALSLLLGLGLALVGLLLPLLWLPALGFILVGLVLLVRAAGRGRDQAATRRGAARLLRAAEGDGSAWGALSLRVSQVRGRLLQAPLPEPARVDLLDAVDEVEDRLDALQGAAQSSADLAAIAGLLDQLDAAAAPEEGGGLEHLDRQVRGARAAMREGPTR